MQLKSLTIENFGIYKGVHTVDLTVTEEKPIVLFGGLNGGGKTTFLDALQLVLYGKHAKCSNRGTQAFGSFLASTKNRFSDQTENVSLTLEFTHKAETDEYTYIVKRAWAVASSPENTKDKLKVFCNGEVDEFVSSNWDDFVNEFIPQSLSDLFFFDGEKIENLANPERSSELIQTGLENLLGLDLLTQLRSDLTVIENERKKNNIDENLIKRVSDCEDEIGEHDIVLRALRNEAASLEEEISALNVAIKKARQTARMSGAHLIEERDSIKFELGAIDRQLKDNLQQRVKIDAGACPLGLIPKLLEETKQQIAIEEKAKQAKELDASISDYEAQILNTLTQGKVDTNTLNAINQLVENNQSERRSFAASDCYIDLPSSIFTGLDERIVSEQAERKKLIKLREELEEKQALFIKQEEAIPDYNCVFR